MTDERDYGEKVNGAIADVQRALTHANYPSNVENGRFNEREVSLRAKAGLTSVLDALDTERSMHAAWRKRAEEAEAALAGRGEA